MKLIPKFQNKGKLPTMSNKDSNRKMPERTTEKSDTTSKVSSGKTSSEVKKDYETKNSLPKTRKNNVFTQITSYDMPWVAEAKLKAADEEEAYQKHISQPYYKTREKPTKEQWKKTQAKTQSNQGTVTAARKVSPVVRTINNYIGEAQHGIQDGSILLKGKYVLPAIGLASAAPQVALSMASNPVTTITSMGGGYIGDKAVNKASEMLTGKDWGENVSDWTGLHPTVADFTNPGAWYGGYKGYKLLEVPVTKRAVETAMRTSPAQDGLRTIVNSGKEMIRRKDHDRMRAIRKYILTGKTTGDKGYYNSLIANPNQYYGGFSYIPHELKGAPDVIDAYLYGKQMDPRFGFQLKSKGKDFGIHSDYVAEKYPLKAKNIQVYETSETNPLADKIKVRNTEKTEGFINNYDAAGHKLIYGEDEAGNLYTMEQDIWKFNPKDYIKKWFDNEYHVPVPLWKKALLRSGLEVVDRAGTPLIVKSPWRRYITANADPEDFLYGIEL